VPFFRLTRAACGCDAARPSRPAPPPPRGSTIHQRTVFASGGWVYGAPPGGGVNPGVTLDRSHPRRTAAPASAVRTIRAPRVGGDRLAARARGPARWFSDRPARQPASSDVTPRVRWLVRFARGVWRARHRGSSWPAAVPAAG
jgi:hypothetical protein